MKRKKELNPYFAGALISGAASIVEEVGGRMRAGLSFKEALSETFTDRKSLAAIGAKAAIGSLILGVTSDVAVACTRRCTSRRSVALRTATVTTAGGVVDNALKQRIDNSIKGVKTDDTNRSNIVKNLLIPFASSVIAQSIIALGSSRSGIINYSRKAIEDVRISRPKRAARVAYSFEAYGQMLSSLVKVL